MNKLPQLEQEGNTLVSKNSEYSITVEAKTVTVSLCYFGEVTDFYHDYDHASTAEAVAFVIIKELNEGESLSEIFDRFHFN